MYSSFSDWLLMAVVLDDDTKLLVLYGTMQYKVHKWYVNRMNGKLPYELGLEMKRISE